VCSCVSSGLIFTQNQRVEFPVVVGRPRRLRAAPKRKAALDFVGVGAGLVGVVGRRSEREQRTPSQRLPRLQPDLLEGAASFSLYWHAVACCVQYGDQHGDAVKTACDVVALPRAGVRFKDAGWVVTVYF
jgi:hypothetical protein